MLLEYLDDASIEHSSRQDDPIAQIGIATCLVQWENIFDLYLWTPPGSGLLLCFIAHAVPMMKVSGKIIASMTA